MHGFERGGDEVAVVADGDVAAGGEGEGLVDCHFFANCFSEGFCPFELAGVALHFELVHWSACGLRCIRTRGMYVFVTFRTAKHEFLPIVAHKGDALARILGPRAEI